MVVDGVARIVWHDDVDMSNVQEIKTELDRVIGTVGLRTLIIDLHELDFIDSMGVGALIHARNRCLEIGAMVTLRRVPGRTMRLLTTAGLAELFDIDR